MRDLVLAQGESLIKKYTYVKHVKGRKKVASESSLIVTDKRVVKEIVSKNYVARQEMPLSAVDFVDCTVKHQGRSLKKAVISTVLAMLFLVTGILFNTIITIPNLDPMLPCYVGYGFGVLSLVLAISFFIAWSRSCGCSVDVVLLSYKSKNALFGASIKSEYEHIKTPKLKIEIDKAVADEMVEELSAVIFTTKGN